MGIQIENEFEVPASVQAAWDYLLDVEKVARCAPGAELTEVVDDRTWKGKVTVKLGPVSLAFAGTVVVQERDDEQHRVVLKAQGMEQRGKGAATAVVTAWAEEVEGGTRVRFMQDLTVSGAVAQYSRGMVQDVSARLTRDFAECVRTNIGTGTPAAASKEPGTGPSEAEAKPRAPAPAPRSVGGIRLGLWALARAAGRFFARIFRRRPAD
jgi:uncharacterized protein